MNKKSYIKFSMFEGTKLARTPLGVEDNKLSILGVHDKETSNMCASWFDFEEEKWFFIIKF